MYCKDTRTRMNNAAKALAPGLQRLLVEAKTLRDHNDPVRVQRAAAELARDCKNLTDLSSGECDVLVIVISLHIISQLYCYRTLAYCA